MPDFWEQLSAPTPTPSLPTAPVGGPQAATGDFFSQLGASPVPQSVGIPGAQPIQQDEEPSWWDKYGREAELAAAGGLALLLGPKLGKGLTTAAEHLGAPGQAVLQTARNVKAIAAPSTVDEAAGRAAGSIRQESGLAAQKAAQAETNLEPFWKSIGASNPDEQRNFISYIENRSKGATIPDPSLQPLADEIKILYEGVHQDMGGLNRSQIKGYIEDYYRHQWVDSPIKDRLFSKEGSKSFTKERTIPTIEQGMAMGLTPRSLDPVQTTLEYVSNARRFIAANKILDEGEKLGDVVFRPLGSKAKFPTDENWTPIEGAVARKGGGQLYAKEGWARVYNNWRSAGFTGPAGDVMQTMRRASNTITGMELGLSGFHFTTMVNEAIVNDVAKAVTNVVGGNIKEAVKNVVMSPTAPVRLYRTGKKLEDVYLGKAGGSPEMQEMSDLLAQAGGRAKGRSHAADYEFTAMGDFFKSWKRGSLDAEMNQLKQGIKDNPVVGGVKAVGSVLGRTMQSIMYPLFEKYIPRLKTGAFYDTMGQWMQANPMATPTDKLAQARIIWDSIDNRFGEAVNDNIFWKQHMKQVAMLSLRSYSWDLGTVREIGGGLADIGSHKLSPRAAYVIALPIVYGTIGALYQKIKTGESPQDLNDLIAPRTGGTDAATGLPERMIMPGYMKDVFGWYDSPTELAKHKLSTFFSTLAEVGTGTDWRGAPIAPPSQDPSAPLEETAPPWLKAYFNHVASKFVPLSARELYQGPKIGSNISVPEQMLGLQPGGKKYVDRQGLEAYKRYRDLKAWRSKTGFDARQQSQYGGTE